MEAFQPDLVLLDLLLPGLGGFEVCQKIRERSAWNRVRIIIVSARALEAEVSKGLALGADAYITKPFSTHALLDRVRSLLQA
jgi:two-component system, OmpR family, alkaline phosphatase synthesis response regulator PhoP